MWQTWRFAFECYPRDSRSKPQKYAAYYKKKAEYYTQRSLLAEKDDLQNDESSADEANNPSFYGMASIDSRESDQEVSTSYNSYKVESMFSKLDRKLTSLDSMHSTLLKKLAFYERENILLTEEKDKFYKEYTSSFEIFKKQRNTLNEKITLLEKSLKDKTSEIWNILHEKSNVVSLTNFFQKERQFLHQDLLHRELKIRKF